MYRYWGHTLAEFSEGQIHLARVRVKNGAYFLNAYFPGWQRRIQAVGEMLYMQSSDYCAGAVAAKGLRGPSGKIIQSHGDLCREFDHKFMPVCMGFMEDSFVTSELLGLLWKEAADTIGPENPKLSQELQRLLKEYPAWKKREELRPLMQRVLERLRLG